MGDITFSRLSLLFITGYNDEGEPVMKAKHFNNIIPQADSEKLFQTALALASLQKHDLDIVERSNTYELGN
ncbi:DUF1659 domain-containing protein [Evansella sp. AB-P1]|uniref:DUF1659 domain-containing protein n=1 Tax=Evansella sp. AB-P1 TaxID=3037653 RepID=UPI00241D9DA5|nr:DUF1659 domain-containing protein [Evansella sp. AB-P1]MDG5789215.1 DUF1659 domain-containing protein [Evansella sp. AB-P1]